MRSISILGSTGSIGCNTLKVVEHLGDVRVAALAAGRNMDKFASQIAQFQPAMVSCETSEGAEELSAELHRLGVSPPRIEIGLEGLEAVACHEQADTMVSATVGAVGFVPTLRAIEAGKRIALANKETLVIAGDLMTAAAERSGAEIIPVDSEHNAIHQCLRGEKLSEVKRLILTASGGPFREKSLQDIENATPAEALKHPNWSMGDKITIDSATLMNKGFEVMEARWLFGIEADRISVVVHPQSIVHSLVELNDGSMMAQLGVTDMKHAIQYALTFPERRKGCLDTLDLTRLSALTFEEPDHEKFPCLGLAYSALKTGGTMPAVLNAANEISVRAFLDGNIRLTDIARINGSVMSEHDPLAVKDLETVLAADEWARGRASTMTIHSATAA